MNIGAVGPGLLSYISPSLSIRVPFTKNTALDFFTKRKLHNEIGFERVLSILVSLLIISAVFLGWCPVQAMSLKTNSFVFSVPAAPECEG